ncbi:MAG: CHC2 zinc finger domain-containing protein [Rhodospirillaceae bacterium]
MGFAPGFVDEVKRRTSLIGLVTRTVKLSGGYGRNVMRGACPFCGSRSKTLDVNDTRGTFKCYKCGQHGDAITWVQSTTSAATFLDAVNELAADAGLIEDKDGRKPAKPKPIVAHYDAEAAARDVAQKIEWSRAQWAKTVDLAGTLGERYFEQARYIRADMLPGGLWPCTLRFMPACDWVLRDERGKVIRRAVRPAVIAAVQGGRVGGELTPRGPRGITGIHRTYLAPDGRGKAGFTDEEGDPADKKMGGVCIGGAVRLGPYTGAELDIGEGIESTLTVMMGTGVSAWAALSLDNMGLLEPPEGVKRLTKWLDADESDRAQAKAKIAAGNERHTKMGLTVTCASPPEGFDWNSLHLAKMNDRQRAAGMVV